MGYRLETYSLQELTRISMPGVVVPCLFWCVPVGAWPQGRTSRRSDRTLEAWWSWFTERESRCHEIGLLLIKSDQQIETKPAHVDLQSLQATLAELMPPGVGNFLGPGQEGGKRQQLLVLSAAYPQPGWGVLLECGEPSEFERLVDEVIGLAAQTQPTPALSSIVTARDLHRRCQRHEQEEPPRPDATAEAEAQNAAIRAWGSVCDLLRKALAGFDAGDVEAGSRSLREACDAAQALPAGAEDTRPLLELARQASLALLAVRLVNIEDGTEREHIAELCDRIRLSPKDQSKVLKDVADTSLKQAVGACVGLMERQVAASAEACITWARDSFEALSKSLAKSARDGLAQVESRLALLRGQRTVAEEAWRQRHAGWLEEGQRLHADCRLATAEAAETLWRLGPSFLAQLERTCKERGIPARSIPWDPPRMVGWKVATCGIGLKARDLWECVKEMGGLGKEMAPDAPRPPSDGDADGSYFTDYVHYVAMSKPEATPYSVTRDLLQMLRTTELERLITAHGGKEGGDKADDRSSLARQALDALGWREHVRPHERSLADCLESDAAGRPTLKADVRDLAKLRPVVESFCKDFIDTVVQEIGCDEKRLWEAVRHHHPGYRSQARHGGWATEMEKLTVGPAAMICEAILPLAFPAKEPSVTIFVKTLERLGSALNASSHHNADLFAAEQPDPDVSGLVASLIDAAHAMVGEMPWHLEATAVYGEQPRVLTGMAWSHSSGIPRQIRVMDWTNAARGRSLTLWNKTGRNPIITDPVFIRRPGRR